MPFKIVRNDITGVKVDAIVNTANEAPIYGDGVDTAVYEAAGVDELLAERRKIGFMNEGEVAITPGFNLPAKYIDLASEILQIMGHFIVSSIRRRNLVRRLEIMSYTDPLTGFGNRYAMEKYVSGILPQTKIGVVYCDVTGLKRVNDEEGHSKGDQLILRACDCLKRTLKKFELFRIGGDELVALCRGMEEGELYREVEELRAELDREHVTMAVGAAVNTLGAVGFDHLLTEPERRMYQDKAEYYRQSGLNRRRQ